MDTSSTNSAAELRLLAKLINDNLENIITEYEKAGQEPPSVNSLISGPLDTRDGCTDELKYALKTVQGACAQLLASVETPSTSLAIRAFSHYDSSCLNVVVNAKIADYLDESPAGLSLGILAQKSAINEDKLGRVLRYLSMKHIFREGELSPNVFVNNRLSINLKSEDPVSSTVGHLSDEVMLASAKLSEALADPEFRASRSVDHTAFRKALGSNVFAYYHSEEGKERGLRFNKAMIGTMTATGAGQITKVFPWGDLPKGSRLCDIGGGKGHAALGILKAFPGLRAVVQDLPGVILDAKEFWESEMPEAIKSHLVELEPIDFLTEAPVKGCEVYYMRFIIHDWPDAESVKIMSNIRSVMPPGSRLLLHEWVLQPMLRQSGTNSSQKQAPEPLLANFGAGGITSYSTDINMMCCVNAKERTLAEFIQLGSEANLKFVKFWECGDMGVLEFGAA